MDVTPIITRLKAQLSGFVAVGGAADVDQAIEHAPATPAAYVMPLAESAEEPSLIGLHQQRLALDFGVLIVISNLRDPSGAAAAAELATRRAAVRTALMGWVPDADTGEPVFFVGGRLLQFRDQRLWWTDEFRVFTHYRSA